LLAALFAAIAAQTVTLECSFGYNYFNLYTCTLEEVEVTDPSATIVFTGAHIEGKSDEDVEAFMIQFSNTPFIIPHVLTAFPRLEDLDIRWNTITELVEFPLSEFLRQIEIHQCNISRIENGTFRNLPRLEYLDLKNNGIEMIEENAFEGLTAVKELELSSNRIHHLAVPTFLSMASLRSIDLSLNNLTRLDESLFAGNRVLRELFIEYNQINEVSPTFPRYMRTNGVYQLDLIKNVCIDQANLLSDESGFWSLNNALQTCFQNYLGNEVSDVKSVETRFSGKLNIYDEFGNLIGRA
jgi:hypothetical protein